MSLQRFFSRPRESSVGGFWDDPFFDRFFVPMPVIPHRIASGVHLETLQRFSSPGFMINENDKEYKLAIDLPGVKAADMTCQLEDFGRVLRLTGGRKVTSQEEDGKTAEKRFDQRFSMGRNIDTSKVTADLTDGVLTVSAPKMEKEKDTPIIIPITEGLGRSRL